MADNNDATSTTQLPAAPFDMVFAKLKNFKQEFMSCDGRARRGEYWCTALLFTLPMVLLTIFGTMLAIFCNSMTLCFLIFAVIGVLGILMLPVSIRRWHDFGVTGWVAIAVMFANMIPILGTLVSIAGFVFMCLPGTRGANAFGADPLDPTAEPIEGKKEPPVFFFGAALLYAIIVIIIAAVQFNAASRSLRGLDEILKENPIETLRKNNRKIFGESHRSSNESSDKEKAWFKTPEGQEYLRNLQKDLRNL